MSKKWNKIKSSPGFQFGMKVAAILVIALFSVDLLYAPPPRPDPNIPIDGGITWLIAAGVAYGAKKTWDHNKKK